MKTTPCLVLFSRGEKKRKGISFERALEVLATMMEKVIPTSASLGGARAEKPPRRSEPILTVGSRIGAELQHTSIVGEWE